MKLRVAYLAMVIGILACSDITAPSKPVTLPIKPTNVTVSQTSNSLQLTWVDQSSNEDSYRVEVSVNGGSWALLTQTGANATSASMANPSPATQYRFRVSACNSVGCSDTVESVITTREAVAQPTLQISEIIKTAADGVQINVLLPSKLTGSVTVKLRRPTEAGVLFTKTQEWAPNLPLTVDFYFNSLDPNTVYEVEATLVANGATTVAPTRTFRLSTM